MGQRLVLASKSRDADGEPIVSLGEIEEFIRRAKEFDLGPRYQVRISEDTNTYLFWVVIPEGKQVADRKKVQVKRKTKKQLAVEKQIADHKEAVAQGKEIPGHVPAVGAPRRKRRRIVIKRRKK